MFWLCIATAKFDPEMLNSSVSFPFSHAKSLTSHTVHQYNIVQYKHTQVSYQRWPIHVTTRRGRLVASSYRLIYKPLAWISVLGSSPSLVSLCMIYYSSLLVPAIKTRIDASNCCVSYSCYNNRPTPIFLSACLYQRLLCLSLDVDAIGRTNVTIPYYSACKLTLTARFLIINMICVSRSWTCCPPTHAEPKSEDD